MDSFVKNIAFCDYREYLGSNIKTPRQVLAINIFYKQPRLIASSNEASMNTHSTMHSNLLLQQKEHGE